MLSMCNDFGFIRVLIMILKEKTFFIFVLIGFHSLSFGLMNLSKSYDRAETSEFGPLKKNGEDVIGPGLIKHVSWNVFSAGNIQLKCGEPSSCSDSFHHNVYLFNENQKLRAKHKKSQEKNDLLRLDRDEYRLKIAILTKKNKALKEENREKEKQIVMYRSYFQKYYDLSLEYLENLKSLNEVSRKYLDLMARYRWK